MYLQLVDALKLKRPGLTVAVMSCGKLMQFARQDAYIFVGPSSSQECGIGMEVHVWNKQKWPSLFGVFHILICFCIIDSKFKYSIYDAALYVYT